jgi:hypothetical protein
MLVLEVECAGPKGADIATKYVNTNQVVVIMCFSGQVNVSLSDNIQRGAMRGQNDSN